MGDDPREDVELDLMWTETTVLHSSPCPPYWSYVTSIWSEKNCIFLTETTDLMFVLLRSRVSTSFVSLLYLFSSICS